MALTVEEAISRVPHFVNAADLKVSPLGGGITNRNYRVEVGGEVFVLRIAGANTEMLGIDRQNEYQACRAASEAGIGPEVVYFIEPEGYLVTRFVPGRKVPPQEIRTSQSISEISRLLLKVHAMGTIPGTFSPFRIVEEYAEIAHRYQVAFPGNFDWLIARMNAIEEAFLVDPFTPHPCHNDLLNENFLYTDRFYILDWEYAGMGDLFFDLANFSVHHGFSHDEDRHLLESYFGAVTTPRWARLKLMKIMSDFRESMWGMVQIGISQLDFDFRAYADKHFDRLTANMQDPLFKQWLKEVTQTN
jgi:thiamine kinase-like enzyme